MLKKILKWTGILGAGAGVGYIAFKPKKAKAAPAKVIAKGPASAATATGGASLFAGFPVPKTVTTSSDPLNVRATSSAKGALVGTVAKGSTVQQTGPAVQGDGTQSSGWVPIMQGSIIGFASGNFLS